MLEGKTPTEIPSRRKDWTPTEIFFEKETKVVIKFHMLERKIPTEIHGDGTIV